MLLFWKIAFRSLFRNGRRNLLTGTSIGLGLVGVSLLGAYILRMERYLAAQSIYLNLNGHVVVYAKEGLDRHLENPDRYSLGAKEQTIVRKFAAHDPRVLRLVPVLRATGLVHNGCSSFPFHATAVDPEDIRWTRNQEMVWQQVPELARVARGKGFWEATPQAQPLNISSRLAAILRKETLLGESNAKESAGVLDCSRPEEKTAARLDPNVQLVGLGFQGGMALADGVLSGHVNNGMAFEDDTALLLPLPAAQQMYGTDKVTALALYLHNENAIPAVLRDLQQEIAQSGGAADLYPFFSESVSAFYVGGMQFNWVMLYLFLALVCSVVGISISNSLYISLMERKAELGTLRSIGFSQSKVGQLLVLESFFLLIFSILPGLLVAQGIAILVNSANLRFEIPGLSGDLQFRLQLTFAFVALVITLLSLLVILVTWLGGARFLRKPILDLLGGPAC